MPDTGDAKVIKTQLYLPDAHSLVGKVELAIFPPCMDVSINGVSPYLLISLKFTTQPLRTI